MTFAPATPNQLDQLGNFFWFSKKNSQTPVQVLVNAHQDPWHIQVRGNVRLHKNVLKLPYVFTEVDGEFYASYKDLKTLTGFPRIVHEGMYLRENQLTNLIGAPDHVGGEFNILDNPLTSLEGLPSQIDQMVIVSYDVNLPLLRLIQVPHMKILDAPTKLDEIMRKYEGKGKHHILLCSNELKQAGFGSNARW
jgi:hypothetical protein